MQSTQTEVKVKGKENPGQAEQRQRSVRSQPLKSPPQPSGQHLRLPTCRLGRLQEPGPFGSGHFQRQLVKTLGVGPGYANDSKEVGTSWQLSLSMSDTTWGLSACAPSRYSPRPTAQARRLLIPPPPTTPSPRPLSNTWETCPETSPSLHYHPHGPLPRLLPYRPHRSPHFYFSSFNLALHSAVSDHLK